MSKLLRASVALVLTAGIVACKERAPETKPPPAPPKPGWEYTSEDFGIGRKHTANAWCNRQIDALLEETRRCFNAYPAPSCQDLQQQNSKKMGGYIRSPRCAK